MGADSSSGKIDDGERRGGNEAIRGEQDNPIRIPSSSSSSSSSSNNRRYRFKLRSASRSRLMQIRNADQSDGGAALPAEDSSTRTKDDVAAEAGAKTLVGFFPRMGANESGPSRIRAWRLHQCLSWDLSKIEPLQRDKETNRTRILAFSPQIELVDNLEYGKVDMERVELRQERDYLNFMDKIKDFNPHVITMDYEECNIGYSKESRGKMEAEPVIKAIQQAIDDGEIDPQYFIILGDLPTFSKHAALEYQTDGWMIKRYFGDWLQLPRKADYWFQVDDIIQYYRDVYENKKWPVHERWAHILPQRHFDDPLLDGDDNSTFVRTPLGFPQIYTM